MANTNCVDVFNDGEETTVTNQIWCVCFAYFYLESYFLHF